MEKSIIDEQPKIINTRGGSFECDTVPFIILIVVCQKQSRAGSGYLKHEKVVEEELEL